jgi:hypothetical protein
VSDITGLCCLVYVDKKRDHTQFGTTNKYFKAVVTFLAKNWVPLADELQRRIAPEAKPPAAASSTSAMTTPEFVKVTDVDVDDDDEDFGRDIAFSAGVKYGTSDRLRSVPTVWPIPNLEKVGKDTRSRADSPARAGLKALVRIYTSKSRLCDGVALLFGFAYWLCGLL